MLHNFCHKKGATIFEPRNQLINDKMYDLTKNKFNVYSEYWIGIIRSSDSDNWKWTKDFSVVSFFNWWSKDQPNMDEDCVTAGFLSLGAKWWNTSCEYYEHVICEMPVVHE